MNERIADINGIQLIDLIGIPMSAKDLATKKRKAMEDLDLFRGELSSGRVKMIVLCVSFAVIALALIALFQFGSMLAIPFFFLFGKIFHESWINSPQRRIEKTEMEVVGLSKVDDSDLGTLYNYAADCPEIMDYVKSVYAGDRDITRQEFSRLREVAGNLDHWRTIAKAKKAFGVGHGGSRLEKKKTVVQ